MKVQLNYRLAEPKDWPAIIRFIDKSKYFFPVEPSSLGGKWAIAEDATEIKACLWFFNDGPNAYIDYWVGGRITSITLLMFVAKLFQDNGIKFVRGSVHGKNESAIRTIVHGFDAVIGTENHSFFKVM